MNRKLTLGKACASDETVYNLCVICEQLNLSAGRVGLLMIGLSLPYGAASPVFGIISDKYPVSVIYYHSRC